MTAKKISEAKAKSLFRAASIIRPQSIATLKCSIANNKSNLLSFASHINNCSSLRRRTTERSKGEEEHHLNGQANSQRGTCNLDVQIVKESVFVRTNVKQKPNLNKQAIINREGDHAKDQQEKQQKPKRANKLHSTMMPSQRKRHTRPYSNYQFPSDRSISQQLMPKDKNSLEYTRRQKQRINSQISQPCFKKIDIKEEKHKGLSRTQRFWKKRGKVWEHQGIKSQTEAKEIKKATSLSRLICFDSTYNQKAVNYLVLQLQVNLASEKNNKLTLTKR